MTAKLIAIVFALIATTLANAQDTVPDFGHDLSREVSEVEPLGLEPSKQQLREVADMVGKPPAFIAGIRLYRGKIKARKGGMVDAWLAMIPLGKPIRSARLALAMDAEDTIQAVGVWGTEDFDSDPIERWTFFLNALRGQSFPRLRDREMEFSAVEAKVKKIGHKSKADGELADVLIDLRRGMIQNSMLVGVIGGLLNRGENFPGELIDPMIDAMAALTDAGPFVKSVIGEDGAEGFTDYAMEALQVFEDAKELNTEFSPEEVAEFLRPQFARTGICSKCHNGRSEGIAKTWRGALRSKLFALGVPGGMMQPGFDIPIAAGDDGEISRELGAAFRGAIMLMDRLKAGENK